MTTLRRDVASLPVRSPSQTWETICDLVAGQSIGRADLVAATDVATQLIAQEALRNDALIFSGNGPQVRVYTLHEEDATSAEPDDERPLVNPATEGEWSASFPADASDVEWASRAITKVTSRIAIRESGT
jgi:hypothetical protein